MVDERRFYWTIVWMSEMWKKYGIEGKNGSKIDMFVTVLPSLQFVLLCILYNKKLIKQANNETGTRHFVTPVEYEEWIQIALMQPDRSLHIEQTRKKAQAVHAVLKRLISRRSKLAIRHKVLLYKSIIRPVMSYGSQIWGSAGMCHLKKLHTLTNSFLRQIVNAPWFVRNEVIYRDLKIKPFLPHIKDLSKRFFDKLPSVPNELISNQPAYDPAVPSSQKRPRALLEHEFINFPQAKRLRVQI
ncbi:RNA-directed DNA polymerase from mobile element jockey [Trichonephila clavipes]|uniref:RNA-directed DNA polymerase from mobile element jockey n=1 Tax=Trichonephila clavipes TaxID=2585209 RepID=A0A8X6SSA5_TRICX|nr:RNA-directed DNA polymerase from mobile element jockey [Trichonephila clavipes]